MSRRGVFLRMEAQMPVNKRRIFFFVKFSINFDLSFSGNQYMAGKQMDQKSDQWFGATLSTSGASGGPVVVSREFLQQITRKALCAGIFTTP